MPDASRGRRSAQHGRHWCCMAVGQVPQCSALISDLALDFTSFLIGKTGQGLGGWGRASLLYASSVLFTALCCRLLSTLGSVSLSVLFFKLCTGSERSVSLFSLLLSHVHWCFTCTYLCEGGGFSRTGVAVVSWVLGIKPGTSGGVANALHH